MSKAGINRREFIKGAAATVGFPYIIPASALGKFGSVAPSNRITMGCIGLGGQGTSVMKGFLRKSRLQVVAVCDVNKEGPGYLGSAWGGWKSGVAGREPAKRMVEEHYSGNTASGSYKGCASYGDFRELLTRDDIDTVMTALPDHWHAIVAVAAARAGKDVYGEKPLGYTVSEGRAICEAVKKYGIVWQTGSQQRSDWNFRFASELVRNGRIGKVHTVKVMLPGRHSLHDKNNPNLMKPAPVPQGFDYDMWLGPAPWAEYIPGRCHFNFRWVSDYAGGQITDWSGHHIDIMNWAMGTEGTGPIEVSGKGRFSKGVLYDTAEDFNFTCKYAEGFTMTVQGVPKGFGGIRFEGDDGWIFVGRQEELEAEPKSLLNTVFGADEIRLYNSNDHKQDFIDCVLSRSEPVAPAEAAQRAITVGHLSLIAMKSGRKLKWDGSKERFINDAEADKFLSRPMRSPWCI